MRLIPIISNEIYDQLMSHSNEYLAKHGYKKYNGKLFYGVKYGKSTAMSKQHRGPHYIEIVAPRDRYQLLTGLFNSEVLRMGRDSFFYKIRQKYGNIPRQYVENYQLHFQQPREKIAKPVSDKKINSRWQMDHVDMSDYKNPRNRNASFLFVVIDVFSKYAWVRAVSKKDATRIVSALEEIFEENKRLTGRYPSVMQSDNAREFNANIVKDFFEEHGVKQVFSPSYLPQAQGIVERFNRTLKNAIFSNFTKRGTNQYVDILPEIVNSYNNSFHTTIKDTPARIHRAGRVSVEQQKGVEQRNSKWLQSSRNYPKIRIGSQVRTHNLTNKEHRKKDKFAKRYKPQWSEEIFTVNGVFGEGQEKKGHQKKIKTYYTLEGFGDKHFHRRDLQKIKF
jgi:transposase InsO family protein